MEHQEENLVSIKHRKTAVISVDYIPVYVFVSILITISKGMFDGFG